MALKAKIPPATGSPRAFALCCGSTRVWNMWSWTGSGFCWFSEILYIYVTIRGKHGSHELDGPTNQELLQGENSRTRFFLIFAGKNRGNTLSISTTKSIQWSPNPQGCHGFPKKLENSTGKKKAQNNQHGKIPQFFPTFFLKVNGLPGRHAPAAHFKRPGQGGFTHFFVELFFKVSTAKNAGHQEKFWIMMLMKFDEIIPCFRDVLSPLKL